MWFWTIFWACFAGVMKIWLFVSLRGNCPTSSWHLSAWSSKSAVSSSSSTDPPTTLTISSRWSFCFKSNLRRLVRGSTGFSQAESMGGHTMWGKTFFFDVQHQCSWSSRYVFYLESIWEIVLKDCILSRGCSEPSRYSSSCNYLWSSNSRCYLSKHDWFLWENMKKLKKKFRKEVPTKNTQKRPRWKKYHSLFN